MGDVIDPSNGGVIAGARGEDDRPVNAAQAMLRGALPAVSTFVTNYRVHPFVGLVPDPLKVFSQTPKWHTLTAQYTEKVAEEVLAAPYRDLFADNTLFSTRPFVRNWIAERANRLNRVPDEVYGAVAQIIDSATTNGASIPDVTEQVEKLLDAADVQQWKNRARTVARHRTAPCRLVLGPGDPAARRGLHPASCWPPPPRRRRKPSVKPEQSL